MENVLLRIWEKRINSNGDYAVKIEKYV